VQAECLALQANLAQTRGDLAGSLEAAQRSLALVPESSNRVKGLALLALGGVYRQSAGYPQAADALQQAAQASRQSQDWVTWMLAVTLLTQLSIQYGRLQFAAGIASHAVEELNRLHIAPPPVVGAVYGALGLVDFEANHVESARLNFGRGIRLATFSGHSGSLVYNKLHLARLLQTEGELAAAAQTLEEAAGLLRAGAPGWMRPELIYRQVSLLLAMGKAAEAEAILHQAGITPADEVSRRSEWIHLAWLRLLVARRDASAQALAGNILRFSEAGERNGTSLLALILGALAGGGGDWLGRALQLAESEGYVRIFTDEGEPLAALLRKLPATEYICKLLATFPAAVSTGEHPKGHPGLVEPLTDREREVLRLLAEGLSYGKIAERLVVSVNTVRFHVKGIYGKLGVEKQVQAVEKGRELGLIR
jgi:LuxR family maltose regulon positive regulatory protein